MESRHLTHLTPLTWLAHDSPHDYPSKSLEYHRIFHYLFYQAVTFHQQITCDPFWRLKTPFAPCRGQRSNSCRRFRSVAGQQARHVWKLCWRYSCAQILFLEWAWRVLLQTEKRKLPFFTNCGPVFGGGFYNQCWPKGGFITSKARVTS